MVRKSKIPEIEILKNLYLEMGYSHMKSIITKEIIELRKGQKELDYYFSHK